MDTKNVIAALAFVGLTSGCAMLPGNEPQSIPVAHVVEEIKLTLAKVAKKDPGFKFKSAELTLETVFKKGATTGIDFWIVSSEASVSNSMTQQAYYKLTQSEAKVGLKAAEVSLSDQMSDAILKAKQAITNAELGTLINSESAVLLKFVVEKSATSGAKVELVPVKVGVKGSVSKSASHTIKITFV